MALDLLFPPFSFIFRFHKLSHTFSTLIQPHTDIKTLQTIIIHSDIEATLDRYTLFAHENVSALAPINTRSTLQTP